MLRQPDLKNWAVTFTLTVMASERATPNDESTSAYGVRRLAATLGGCVEVVQVSPSPNSGSKLPHSISGGVAAGVAVTFTLMPLGRTPKDTAIL